VGQAGVRGIRGAITVEENCSEEIRGATRHLVQEMVEKNGVHREDIAAVILSTTPDIDAAFPAGALREMGGGWELVPLFGTVEMNVPGSLARCIRVLILTNTGLKQEEIKHVYLKEARQLRDDL